METEAQRLRLDHFALQQAHSDLERTSESQLEQCRSRVHELEMENLDLKVSVSNDSYCRAARMMACMTR